MVKMGKSFCRGMLMVIWLACAFSPAIARRHAPLHQDDDGARKIVRAAECTLGGHAQELGSTWFADLGPPFGVMYCIKCECVPVHKKKKIVAKVQCRNIKNDCPKPTCDEPILHPGRCCKTCPGDVFSPDTLQDLPPATTLEEEEKDARHFAALLVGPRQPPAALRFILRRRSLHFALEGATEARALQILDGSGSVLQEIPVGSGAAGILAGRSCGAWRRLPRDYRRALRDGKLSAALIWGDDAEPQIVGQIVSHGALGTEMFSSLLEVDAGFGSATTGWGATAAISASAGAAASLHITIMFKGVLAADEIADAPVVVKLEMMDKNTTVLEEIRHIRKPSDDINIIEVSSPVSAADLRLLARGRLTLSIRGARKDSNGIARPSLRGAALPKMACDMFYTTISTAPRAQTPLASGIAWLYLNREGELVYNVQVDELNMLASPMITLVDEANKRNTELEDLTMFFRNGLASGFLDRMAPRVLEPLYSGDLVVNVAAHSDESIIRGRFVSRPVADPMDLAGPILLKRPDLSKPADLVGLAWLSVDYECNLQWEVSISGPVASTLILSSLELWLDLRPILAPRAPVTSRRLGTLDVLEGPLLSPGLVDLQRLNTGYCELIVKEPISNTTLLRAAVRQMKIPETCLPQYTDNEVPSVSYVPSHPNSPDIPGDAASCFHSGSFYDDGAQWNSANEPCTMCSCHHGRVRCDAVRCPPLTCGTRALIRPGECCPTCTNSSLQDTNASSTRGCHQAGQFHSAGQSWHPYLPPGGFDTCAICTCEPHTLTVQCPRVSCPALPCSEKLAVRPDRKACCRVCPSTKHESADKSPGGGGELKDEGSQSGLVSRQSPEEILDAGGCRYPLGDPLHNGHEWHPTVHSHGEQKCVTCRCKDGEIKCDRKRCTRSACNNQLGASARRRNHKGGPKPPPPDECCQQHCRRYRRHQKHHRMRS